MIVVAELLLDLFLDRNRDAREQSGEPIEFHEKLSAHLTNADHLTAASFHVDLLLVLEKLLIPIEQIRWWLSVSNVHEAESADVR